MSTPSCRLSAEPFGDDAQTWTAGQASDGNRLSLNSSHLPFPTLPCLRASLYGALVVKREVGHPIFLSFFAVAVTFRVGADVRRRPAPLTPSGGAGRQRWQRLVFRGAQLLQLLRGRAQLDVAAAHAEPNHDRLHSA